MPDATPTKRPSVLLLAGEVRDAWARALEEAGFEVRTAGWLDGVTAARHRRPDVVLVSADLPANARVTVITAFRGGDLSTIPIAVAGVSAGVAERESAHPLRADRYIPLPVTADRLAREVAETIRRGRVPWRRPPEQRFVLALLGVGVIALGVRALWGVISRFSTGAAGLPAALDGWLLAIGVGAVVASVAIGLATKRRPLTAQERRSATGWGAFGLVWLGTVLEPGVPALNLGISSLGCLLGAEWARLGLRAYPPPTRGWRRWYVALIVLSLALAAATWIAIASVRSGLGG